MKTVVFDVETTGFDSSCDEILSISIIDGENNVLFNSYVKPYFHDSWEAAQAVHGILPEVVASAPYPHEIFKQVKAIFDSADVLIAYNGTFDMRFLSRWTIDFSLESKVYHDVMLLFAPIYKEWNEQYGNYKWQKLSTCAAYYGYDFNAHDSLEDVRATLFCFNKIMEDKENGIS